MGETMGANGETERKAQILDAAAELFAEIEYHGTSMRMIAKRANVSQSLIHYHYATKEQLFQAVFERHVTAVNRRRIELLSNFLEHGPRPVDSGLEELVEILIKPWVEVTRSEHKATREFAKFIIRSSYRDDEWSKRLAVGRFSEVRRLGIKAFMTLIPEFSEDDAFRAYFFTLSMFYMPASAPERLCSLAGRKVDMVEPDVLLHYGLNFAVAGIRAMKSQVLEEGAVAKEPALRSQKVARAGGVM